ncbi:hypothetical protein [Flagellimonas halotolerans]|uniref:Uncharacterized protein n=1 Tax=Flagellimonas halotolerans TaxID=3112164 RepID=A0ABU6IKY8_9FLAO|nr:MULTISPECIES: hypothetical protein [unclassified Allomuricauda]MEC3963846.1 hypothetical protein [Muricauda sp. SYSU M86414]MEC4263716.1 hypothetical protein [Muricauda sp. SYSU M84420]
MIYDQQEKFKELISFISTHTIDRSINRVDQKAIEENLKWNASLFFAKAIHLAKSREQGFTLAEFDQFRKDYEDRNGQIDTDSLFQKYWLRNVLGKIKIAGTVSSACHTFSGISSFRNELKFLLEKFPEGIKGKEKLPKAEFDQIKSKYESEHNLILNDEGLNKPSWLSKSDDGITISNINIYFKPYLDRWKEFEFLSAYKEQISNDEDKGLKIAKRDLVQLHESFKKFYTQTPSIADLIKQNLLCEKEEFYYLNFYNVEVSYWSILGDQITAFYWQLLVENESFSDDKERVKMLLQQILYWGWPSDFLSCSLDESKKRFLDAASDLVINETDLDGIESEFKKVSIDGDIGSREVQSLFHSREEFDDFSLNNLDHFELLESLDNWEQKAHTIYLHGQSSRDELSFLIKLIVAHDYEFEREETEDQNNPIIHHYKRVFVLLEKSITKPTLLWELKCFIIMCRREFIPYLVEDSKYTTLAFQFIDRIGEYLLHEDKETIHNKLWVKSMELALFSIRSVGQEDVASKLIFQIYRKLNSNKYDIPYSRQPYTEKLSRKQKEEKETAVLSLIEDSSLQNHKVHGGSSQFLLPKLFNGLVKLFINLPSKQLYNSGTVSFPMLQWDGLTWLMKCSTYWKYKRQFEITPPGINMLTNSFFKLYIDRVEVTEVKKYNFFEKKEEKGRPLWSEKIERLEYIEWIYPIYFIYKQQKLNSFLEPRFYFDSTSEFYHKENHFTADKLRTHIGVLLQVLRQLVLPSIPYGFEKDKIQQIKSRVEQQIIDYLKRHIKDVPEEGCVDLFDYNKEWAFKNSEKEALLPQVARALNWFSKKEQIIEAIIETQDIVKILTIAEWVTSVGVKQKLIERIQQSDIKAFLEKKRWTPEVQQVLLDIRQYPKLEKEINQVVEFWEKRVSKKNREYEVQLYQTKMLLAYFHDDEQELNSIKEPASPIHVVRELSYRDHKQFYRALIRLEKNPESSYTIFKELSSQYLQYPVFALNQMAAKISIAKASDDLKIYKEALEEWKAYSSQQKDLDEEALGSTFLANKLYILLKLGELDELDRVFNDLEKPYKMLPDILEVKIESLIERKRIEEASMLLEEAENYHQFSGGEGTEFIKALKVKVGGIDDVLLLSAYYTRVFNSSPEKLIEIFPPNLNGQRQLQSFLVTEFGSAAINMLDKVVSISDIKDEDKYNDVIEILLNSKINPWGWFVTDQSRGGHSDSENKSKKKQPGERDFKIFDGKGTFGICEAFIYRTPAPAKKHLKKIFDYHPKRENLIILIYDLNEPTKAAKNWNNYLKSILLKTDFPKGYELINCEDVSSDFGHGKKSAVRIARSKHEDELNLYHIFVNINYKVNA